MFEVGDFIFGGMFVIVSISSNYRVFEVRSQVLGDPTGPFTITFDTNQTEDDINAILTGS